MRWLILPDIHDKLRRANQIIEREPHDRLLLMGDFFDDFRTGVTDAADTANQMKQWLNSPTTTCLTHMNPTQRRLFSLLDLQRYAPAAC